MPRCEIAPSLLSCDFAQIGVEANRMLTMKADRLHLDVMDGNFVPNLSFGAPVVKCIRASVPEGTYLDCHLMVTEPNKWVKDFKNAGANGYTFHYEAMPEADIEGLLNEIKAAGMDTGLALSPDTDVPEDLLKDLIGKELIDMMLIMSVRPGFGGQSFMAETMKKVKILRAQYPDLNIQVDGGINRETIKIASESGANVFVSGSAIFKAEDPEETIRYMKSVCQ